MNAAEKKRLKMLLGVLVVVGLLAFWPKSRPTPSARATASAAKRPQAKAASQLTPDQVPTLAVLEPGGLPVSVARNPFAFFIPPTATPRPLPPTPTPFPMAGDPRYIGPMPATPVPPPTPIVPPAIPYKLVGIFGPNERQIAAFEEAGRLISAREGDILDSRFILRKVNRESVDFAFVGLPSSITRRLAMSGGEAGH